MLPHFLDKYRKDDLFIIAEAGTNHQGDIEKAKEFIKVAVRSGCSAIKFQHVIADELLHSQTGLVDLPGGSVPLYETFKRLEQPKKFFEQLMQYCRRQNILFLCSPFGSQSAQDLEELGIQAYKIASPESNYYPLHDKLRSYQKYIFISTGVCTQKDVLDIIEYYPHDSPYCLIHCVTHYPAPVGEYNLLSLLSYKQWNGFRQLVGLSDHSLDAFFIPQIAHHLSCRLQGLFILEKHLTLDKQGTGLDDAIAINPTQLMEMVTSLKKQHQAVVKKSVWSKKDLINISQFDKKTFAQWKKELVNDIADLLTREPSAIGKALGCWGKYLTSHEKVIYATTNRSLRAIKDIEKGETIGSGKARYLRSEKNLMPGLGTQYHHLLNDLVAAHPIANGEEISLEKLIQSESK